MPSRTFAPTVPRKGRNAEDMSATVWSVVPRCARPTVAAKVSTTTIMIAWVSTGPDCGVATFTRDVDRLKPFVEHRALLVEDHPRHDHRADVGGQAGTRTSCWRGDVPQALADGVQVRVRHHDRGDEDQFGEPESYPYPLGPPVAAGHGDADEERRGDRDRQGTRNAEQLTDAGDTGVLGEKSTDTRSEQR